MGLSGGRGRDPGIRRHDDAEGAARPLEDRRDAVRPRGAFRAKKSKWSRNWWRPAGCSIVSTGGRAIAPAWRSTDRPREPDDQAAAQHQRQPLGPVDENRPFVGTEPMPPGRALYPHGLTRAQIEQYVARASRRQGGDLRPVHGGEARRATGSTGRRIRSSTRRFLDPWREALREAAALSDDAAFAKFLRLRADALLTDDYYASDLAWLDLKEPEVRRHLRALRDLPRRPARREDVVRRRDADPQRGGEPETRASTRSACPTSRTRCRSRRRTGRRSAATSRRWR